MSELETLWTQYRDQCFPTGLPAIQEKELRQAFFAGMLAISPYFPLVAMTPTKKRPAMVEKVCRLIFSAAAPATARST